MLLSVCTAVLRRFSVISGLILGFEKNRPVLYTLILSGLGAIEVTEPFHHNTQEHASDDFQKNEYGTFDSLSQILLSLNCSVRAPGTMTKSQAPILSFLDAAQVQVEHVKTA